MATIKDLATGKLFDGPDGAPVPQGYELVAAAGKQHPWASFNEKATSPEGQKQTASDLTRMVKLIGQSEKPKSFDDAALVALGATPLIRQGGIAAKALAPALPKLAPVVGRIATTVGLGKARGEDNTTAAIEGLGAGMAEGVIGLLGKSLGSPARALEAIKALIGKGPDGPTNVQHLERLVKHWQAAPEKGARAARGTYAAKELKEMDPTTAKEAVGMLREQVLRGQKIPGTRLPPVPPGLSYAAQRVLGGPTAPAVADAMMGSHPSAAAAPIMATEGMNPLRAISRMVMP